MTNNRKHTKDFSNRALEMIMRDVLSSMEECLLEASYKNPKEGGFEILEIRPSEKSEKTQTTSEAEVFNFPSKARAFG